jgi:hypothetical protein
LMSPCHAVESFDLNTDPKLIIMFIRGYTTGNRDGYRSATKSHQAALRDLCGIFADDDKCYVSEL